MQYRKYKTRKKYIKFSKGKCSTCGVSMQYNEELLRSVMRLNGHVRCKNGHKNYNIKIK
jgi:hypothetical protein